MSEIEKELSPYVTADNTLKSKVFSGVTKAAVWKEATNKVYHPDHYLPVKDVATRPNEDGSVWRTMTMISNGEKIVENISMDESTGTIRFHVLDSAGQPTNLVRYNVLHEEQGGFTIEYYNHNTEKNEKTPLMGTAAIIKTVENARAACKAAQ